MSTKTKLSSLSACTTPAAGWDWWWMGEIGASMSHHHNRLSGLAALVRLCGVAKMVAKTVDEHC